MDEISATETPERDFEWYFADTLTNVLHARSSEHQVPAADRVGYRTLAAAEAHDYHRCMVCFCLPPRVTEWDIEEELQRARLEQARREYRTGPCRPSFSGSAEGLLPQWPAPLKGPRLRVHAVDHPMINAFAVPGGRIFVTTGLAGALETKAALRHARPRDRARRVPPWLARQRGRQDSRRDRSSPTRWTSWASATATSESTVVMPATCGRLVSPIVLAPVADSAGGGRPRCPGRARAARLAGRRRAAGTADGPRTGRSCPATTNPTGANRTITLGGRPMGLRILRNRKA